MGIRQIIAHGHGGIGFNSAESDPEPLKVPEGVHVVFYVPPGRSLDGTLAVKIHQDILGNTLGLRDSIDKLKAYLINLKSLARITQVAVPIASAITKPYGNEFALDDRMGATWPRVVNGKEEEANYLFDYTLKGPKGKEVDLVKSGKTNFELKVLARNGSEKKLRKLQSFEDQITFTKILEISEQLQISEGHRCVIHWLACRAHLDENVGGLFDDGPEPMLERLCLKQGAKNGIK